MKNTGLAPSIDPMGQVQAKAQNNWNQKTVRWTYLRSKYDNIIYIIGHGP